MTFEEILLKSEKPARYSGGEYNTPDMEKPCDVRFCICMPDLYEVGMSNLGLKILYHVLNNQKNVVCERCFAPALDFRALLKENDIPLMSLETKKPLKEFDMVGFSVQYEMLFTGVLYVMDAAGIPFYAKDRDDSYPIICGGGPSTINPEPIADFFDLFMVGEGEEMIVKLTDLYAKCKAAGKTKAQFLALAEKIEGIYVPSRNTPKRRKIVKKAVVRDFEHCFYPTAQLMPTLEVVHDRAMLELYRGCQNGCRFCQAGYYYRPIRFRSKNTVKALIERLIRETGFDEISLGSLSTGDYPYLEELLSEVNPICAKARVHLALPSLRLSSFKKEFAESSRKSSLTFAPEAGTQRLRDVINKNVTEEEIRTGLSAAFDQGYNSVKLYFMLGLPTETDEDLMGIVELVKMIRRLYHENHKGGVNISVSCSVFIPKPGTPFQWEKQITREEMSRKQFLLKDELRKVKGASFHYHDRETSELEAIFARGDRALAPLIELAYKKGAMFDSWTEHFHYEIWEEAMAELKIDKEKYLGEQPLDKPLPWEFIDIGVTRAFLLREREKAYRAECTLGCDKGCQGCGAMALALCDEVKKK